MKNVTCSIHGLNLRQDLCNECARATPIAEAIETGRVLCLRNDDIGAVKRSTDSRGNVNFQLTNRSL